MEYNLNDLMDILAENTSDELFDLYSYNLFTEGNKFDNFKKGVSGVAKKTAKAVTDGIVKVATSEKMKPVGKAYNAVAEAPGAAAAAFIKKPSVDAPPEVQRKYHQQVIKCKAASKGIITAPLLAVKSLLFGPPDWIISAIIASGFLIESDVNREYKRILTELQKRGKDLVDKIRQLCEARKNNKITDDEFRAKYNEILNEGNKIAANVDKTFINIKNDRLKLDDSKNHNTVQKPVKTESTIINTLNGYFLTESGCPVDDIYEKLSLLVEKVDYSKLDLYPIIEYYCDQV